MKIESVIKLSGPKMPPRTTTPAAMAASWTTKLSLGDTTGKNGEIAQREEGSEPRHDHHGCGHEDVGLGRLRQIADHRAVEAEQGGEGRHPENREQRRGQADVSDGEEACTDDPEHEPGRCLQPRVEHQVDRVADEVVLAPARHP